MQKVSVRVPARAFAASLLVVLLSLPADRRSSCQDLDLISFYRRDTLDAYLERADRQPGERSWRDAAGRGSEAALAAWERKALAAGGAGPGLAGAREAVRGLTGEQVEDRFAEWLVDRFFRKLPAASLSSFQAGVRAGNLAYLFVTVEGQVSFEEATGDPVVRTAEGLAEDRAGWRSLVREGMERSLSSWEAGVQAAAPELLSALPASRRGVVENLLARTREQLALGLRRELEALFVQEEAGFVARRLSDRYSLRRRSEKEAAGEVASRLIAEARRETGDAIARLQQELRGAPADPAGQARIDAAQWQQGFAAALAAGLARWDTAEEKLLLERVAWEREAGRDFADGEKAWASAWQDLSAQRARWQEDIRAVLAAGEEQWRGEQADLASAIHSASEELDRWAADRAGSRSQEVESLVDVFGQASRMIATARTTGTYWLEKLDVDLDIDAPYADIAAAARPPADGTGVEAVLEQVRYWQSVTSTYRGHAEAARERLAGLFSFTLDDDGSEGPLQEVLEGTDPGTLLLDEYQVAVLKARAVAAYWERELSVAQAVDTYARDLGSGRASEAETGRALGDALRAYADARAAYDGSVSALEQAGSGLAGRREAVEAALAETARARDVLERARSAYNTQLALYSCGTGDLFAGQLRERYLSLLGLVGQGGTSGTDCSIVDAMAGYLAAARRHGLEESISLASANIALLVRGSAPAGQGTTAVASLADLRDAAAAVDVPFDTPGRPVLDSLRAAAEGSSGLEQEFWSGQSAAFLAALRAEAQTSLATREEAIRLLSCCEGQAWFSAATGSAPGPGESIEQALVHRLATAQGAYLVARARRERDGLARWLELQQGRPLESLEDPADLLAFAPGVGGSGLTEAEAAARIAQLEALAGFLAQRAGLAGGADGTDSSAELAAFLEGRPWLSAFAAGQGSFSIVAGGATLDCAALGLAGERRACAEAAALLETWRGYAGSAPGLARERGAEGRALIERTLGAAGIPLLGDALPAAAAIPTGAIQEAEAWIAELAGGLEQAAPLLPAWQSERLGAWLDALARYGGAEAARGGLQAPAGAPAGNGLAAAALGAFRESLRTAAAATPGGLAGTYRQYLVAENLSAADSPTVASTRALDQGALAHFESADGGERALANACLEAFNALARAGRSLDSALSVVAPADAEQQAATREFSLAMARFVRGESPDSQWTPADDRHVSAETQADVEAARERLATVLHEISAEQQEIARLGLALDQWRASAESEPDAAPLQRARELDAQAQAALAAAIAGFSQASSAYDAATLRLRQDSALLEQARLQRDVAQDVRDYATGVYLPASSAEGADTGAGGQAWRCPAEQLAFVQEHAERARAALSVLREAVPGGRVSRESGDPLYVQSRDAYRAALEGYLALREAQGDLLEGIEQQGELVRRRAAELLEATAAIASPDALPWHNDDPRVTAGSLEELLDADDADNPWNRLAAAYFCTLGDGQGLRLSFDPQSWALARGDGWADLEAYADSSQQGGGVALALTFERELRAWIAGMDAALQPGADPVALFTRWGLAAGFVKQQLYDANADSSDPAARAVAACLAGSASLEMLDGDSQLRSFLSTNHDTTAGFDCAGYLRDQGERALAGMSAAERELFDFYLALDVLGATGGRGASLFVDSPLLAAWDYLARSLDSAAALHAATAQECRDIGAGLWIAGIVFSVLPGAGLSFMASAVIVFGLGESEQLTADGYTEVATDARSRVQGEGSYGAQAAASGTALARGIDASSAAAAALDEEEARLAGLEGPGWEARPSRSDFLDALAALYRQGGSRVPGPVLRTIQQHYDHVDPAARTTADILASLVREGDLAQREAQLEMLSAADRARARQLAGEDDCTRALAAFMADGRVSDLDALAAGARAAYGSPAFVTEDHGRWLARMQQELGLAAGGEGNEPLEAARAQVREGLEQSLASLFRQRLEGLAEVRRVEWDLEQQQLAGAASTWSARMDLLLARGNAAWIEAGRRIQQEYADWRTSFEERYSRGSGTWDEVVLGFLEGKREWVSETAQRASAAASEQVLAEVGESAGVMSRQAIARTVPRMIGEAPDARQLLSRLVPAGTVARALEEASRYAERISLIDLTVDSPLAADTGTAQSLALVRGFLAEESEELSRRGSLAVADSAALSLREARDGYRALVQEANEGFEAGMDRLFLAAGYSKRAGNYRRDAIIGSTVLSGVVREHQEVEGYEPFPVPGFEVSIDLGGPALAGLTAEGIQARLSAALDELEEQREEVFGPARESEEQRLSRRRSFDRKDYTVDDDDGFWGELWEGIVSLFGEKESGTTHVEQSWSAGTFGAHIGYAPVFVGSPDPSKSYAENILEPGSGQLDHLVGWYGYWEMRVGKGLAELNAPLYDKPLWNDEGSIVEAPTLRAVVDFGVSVGALLTGNPWAIAAIGLADDAFFGMLDVGSGYRSLADVGLDLARSALVGVATAGAGSVTGIAGDLLAPVAGSAAAGIAGAVTWNDESGWGWDSRVLAGRTVGREAFAGYVGSTAGALVKAGIGADAATNRFTAGLSRAAAGLSGEAAQWLYYLGAEASWNPAGLDAGRLAGRALDDMGGLSVNLANVGAIVDAVMLAREGQGAYSADQYAALALAAQRLSSAGVLELALGSTGARLSLGGGGIDLGGAAHGAAKAAVVEALIASYKGSDELKDTLREAWASGDYAAEATVWRVLAGTDTIVETAELGSTARTVAAASGSRTIEIGRIGTRRWDVLDAAVRLQHESWRNGLADTSNPTETIDAVLAHARLARTLGARNSGYLESFTGLLAETGILGYVEKTGDFGAFGRYVAARYDTTDDYWRLVSVQGGRHALEFDNQADIYDEAGNFLVGTGTTGVQTALASYLGVSMGEAARLMLGAGMMSDALGYWNRYTAPVNMGKQIAIPEASDPSTSPYLFTAYHHNQIMDEIAAAVADSSGSASRASLREYLRSLAPAWHDAGDTYQTRYQALRNTMISFYLGSGRIDNEQSDVKQFFGLPSPEALVFYVRHTGLDVKTAFMTPLSAPWPGTVQRSGWSDRIGNVVEVLAGYSFEGQFVSAGFGFGVAHLEDRSVVADASLGLSALLGHSGNTGSQVVGTNGGFHTHLTIYDTEIGNNRYLTNILGLVSSSDWTYANGTPWNYPFQPFDRRFYDPVDLYTSWWRR